MIFSSLDLAPALQQAIDACGYSEMTKVQELAIIPARRGKDILANAQTGTGKTAAFALPILQQMLDTPKASMPNNPRALILTPTRELAEQLAETISRYAQFLPFSVQAFYGGVKMGGQENKLRAGVDILISTPGRLLEHLVQCNLNLGKVDFLVLDEADRMLDMGFISDVMQILQQTNKQRQSLLFSATLSPAVNELAHKLLKNHIDIRVSKQNITADTVEQFIYPVEEKRKIELFLSLLEEQNWYQVLVFTSTKEQADQLLMQLKTIRVDAAICHGDKSQGARRRALADFKAGKIQVLIATEVAARGLDIQGLEYVVNYNLPYLAEDYVHRIGRTGRANLKGQAISFISREEERNLAGIEKLIGKKIKRINKKGFEVSNRDLLVKQVAEKSYSGRTNKASQTKIVREKITHNKHGKIQSAKSTGTANGSKNMSTKSTAKKKR